MSGSGKRSMDVDKSFARSDDRSPRGSSQAYNTNMLVLQPGLKAQP
jgi:hypothetical protein